MRDLMHLDSIRIRCPQAEEPDEMGEQTLADVARRIHTQAVELVAFFDDLGEDDLPQALCQHLRRALAKITGELVAVVQETGAAGRKLR
jgi:hypothetical protein